MRTDRLDDLLRRLLSDHRLFLDDGAERCAAGLEAANEPLARLTPTEAVGAPGSPAGRSPGTSPARLVI